MEEFRQAMSTAREHDEIILQVNDFILANTTTTIIDEIIAPL